MTTKLTILVFALLLRVNDCNKQNNDLVGTYGCCRGMYSLSIDSNLAFTFTHLSLGPDDRIVSRQTDTGTCEASDSSLILVPRLTTEEKSMSRDTLATAGKMTFLVVRSKGKIVSLKSDVLSHALEKEL